VVDVRSRAEKVDADTDAQGHGGGYDCADQNYRTDRYAHADPDGARNQVANLYAIADFYADAHACASDENAHAADGYAHTADGDTRSGGRWWWGRGTGGDTWR
jgi:hypothetical protein